VENQHRKITGYRELTPTEIELMNEIKAKGEEFDALLNRLDTHLEVQRCEAERAGNADELSRIGRAQPKRWLAIARTDLQTGTMAAVRAIAQPTSF
jgi:hypothetical protein